MYFQTLWCIPPHVASQVAVLVLHSWRGIFHGYIVTAGLDIMRVCIPIYILLGHTDFRWRLGVSDVAGMVQQVQVHLNPYLTVTIHFHATPVESVHWLVGSHGVATILPTTLMTSHNWKISLCAVPESSVVVSKVVWSERQFDPCAVWHSVPDPSSSTQQLNEPLGLFR